MSTIWRGWTIGVLGVWLAIAACFTLPAAGVLWDSLIVGILAGSVGFAMIKDQKWQGWTAAILGLWLVVAAFIPDLQTHAGNMWNAVIVGVLLMFAGFGTLGGGTHKVAHLSKPQGYWGDE